MTTAQPAVSGVTSVSGCVHLSHVILGDLGALTFNSHPVSRLGTAQALHGSHQQASKSTYLFPGYSRHDSTKHGPISFPPRSPMQEGP